MIALAIDALAAGVAAAEFVGALAVAVVAFCVAAERVIAIIRMLRGGR